MNVRCEYRFGWDIRAKMSDLLYILLIIFLFIRCIFSVINAFPFICFLLSVLSVICFFLRFFSLSIFATARYMNYFPFNIFYASSFFSFSLHYLFVLLKIFSYSKTSTLSMPTSHVLQKIWFPTQLGHRMIRSMSWGSGWKSARQQYSQRATGSAQTLPFSGGVVGPQRNWEYNVYGAGYSEQPREKSGCVNM